MAYTYLLSAIGIRAVGVRKTSTDGLIDEQHVGAPY